MAELADARDSNSRVLTDLWVRFPPPAQLTQDRSTDDVERFLTLVSFDSKKKLKNCGLKVIHGSIPIEGNTSEMFHVGVLCGEFNLCA